MGKNNEVIKALSTISQVGLSVLSPIIACIIIGKFIMDKLELPGYTMVIAIVLGAISGFYSMVKYILNITKSK